jgi:sec-independent protein translocase protein TatC
MMNQNDVDHPHHDAANSESEINPVQGEAKPFLEHLEDLRWVIIKSLIVMVIFGTVCFLFSDRIVDFFKAPLMSMGSFSASADSLGKGVLRSLHPADFLVTSLKLAALVGLMLASPFVLYFFWSFIAPGLTTSERRAVLPIFISGLFFFLLGVWFCYRVVLKISLYFLWKYTLDRGIMPDWTFDNYISFVSMMMLAFGLTFEMPVVFAFLAKFGLINYRTLTTKRRYAYFILVVLAAIITPPDVASLIILSIPMIGLYELSILVVWLMGREKGAAS